MANIRIHEKPNGVPNNAAVFAIEMQIGGVWYTYKTTWEQISALIAVFDNLQNYYKKSETYTKTEVNNLIAQIPQWTIQFVQSLPTEDISTTTIYMVPKSPAETNNAYDEYINTNGTTAGWEKIGDTEIDLSNYYTKAETEAYVKGDGANYIAGTKTYSTLTTTAQTLIGAINEVKTSAGNAASAANAAQQAADAAQGTADSASSAASAAANAAAAAQSTANGKSTVSIVQNKSDGETIATVTIDGNATQIKQTPTDTTLDAQSANNIANSAVTAGLATKANTSGSYQTLAAGKAAMKTYAATGTDSAPYVYRELPAAAAGAEVEKLGSIVGASVVWNQLVDTNTTSVTITSGHKYIHWNGSTLTKATSDGTAISVTGGTDKIYDISAMFGNDTVATAITTAKFAELFPDYASYAYSANTMQSVSLSGHKVVGKNLFNNQATTNTINNVKFTVDSDGSMYVKGTASARADFYLKGSSSVYADLGIRSGEYIINTNISVANIYCYIVPENGSVTSILPSGTTITINENVKYRFFLRVANGASVDGYVYPMIRFSNIADGTYEPYHAETTTLDHTTLRGLFYLDNGELKANGDIYNSDGSGSVKYGEIDLGDLTYAYDTSSGHERFVANISGIKTVTMGNIPNIICDKYITTDLNSLYNHTVDKGISVHNNYAQIWIYDSMAGTDPTAFKTAMNGVYLVYESATPTTATLTPFNPLTDIEEGGTEEFIDAGVEAGTRDVAIPAGTNTTYYSEGQGITVDIPPVPIIDGDYKVGLTVASGVPTFTFTQETA